MNTLSASSAATASLDASSFLRRVLYVDAATCLATGGLLALGEAKLAAPLGLPGRQRTRDFSTTTARFRERMAFGVIFIDSARITSPNPGSSRMAISRTASGVTSPIVVSRRDTSARTSASSSTTRIFGRGPTAGDGVLIERRK